MRWSEGRKKERINRGKDGDEKEENDGRCGEWRKGRNMRTKRRM